MVRRWEYSDIADLDTYTNVGEFPVEEWGSRGRCWWLAAKAGWLDRWSSPDWVIFLDARRLSSRFHRLRSTGIIRSTQHGGRNWGIRWNSIDRIAVRYTIGGVSPSRDPFGLRWTCRAGGDRRGDRVVTRSRHCKSGKEGTGHWIEARHSRAKLWEKQRTRGMDHLRSAN